MIKGTKFWATYSEGGRETYINWTSTDKNYPIEKVGKGDYVVELEVVRVYKKNPEIIEVNETENEQKDTSDK